MKDILTAKEWLENKFKCYPDLLQEIINDAEMYEEYADYRNKVLEDVYDEYIKLLSSELDKVAGLQITHPHLVERYTEESEVVVKGKQLREQISKLKVK